MTTKSKEAAHSLIERLRGNFAAEGKRSCRDCLRSKAMPSRRVLAVIEGSSSSQDHASCSSSCSSSSLLLLQPEVLLEASSIVNQRLAAMMLALPKNDNDDDATPSNTADTSTSTSTALAQMDIVATSIRLVQLLLYLPQLSSSSKPKRQPLANQSSNSPAATPTQVQGPAALLSPDRLDELIHNLLASLVQSTGGLLLFCSRTKPDAMDSDDYAIDTDPMTIDALALPIRVDARPVACFAFVSILRLQQFCKRRQQWMIPLCKSLCNLAVVAAQKAKTPLPATLLEDAIRTMTKLLEEGTLVLTHDAASRWIMTPPTSPSTSSGPASPKTMLALDHHTFFAKFLSFLVSRIATLLSLLLHGGESGLAIQEKATAPTTSSTTALLWKILATLWGLPSVIRLSRRSCPTRNQDRSPQVNPGEAEDDDAFLHNYNGIASKIEKQLLKIMLVATTTTPTNNTNNEIEMNESSQQAVRRIQSSTLLEALLNMKVKRKTSSAPAVPSGSIETSIQDLLRNGRVLGRALCLRRILHKVSCETAGTALSMDDVEILLKSIECYHSVVLPQCFGLLAAAMYGGSSQQQNTKDDSSGNADATSMVALQSIVSGSLPSLTVLLLHIEQSLVIFDAAKRSQFHRLLIRWMAPTTIMMPSSQQNTDGVGGVASPEGPHQHDEAMMIHPMSQEFVLSLLFTYLMANQTTTTTTTTAAAQPSPLVTLMVKLLFDPRTSTELRWNLSTILLRLQQASPSPRAPTWMMPTLSTLIENAFAALWKDFSFTMHRGSNKPPTTTTTKKKRKRRGSSSNDAKHPHAFHIYNPKDVEAIGHVLAKLSTHHHQSALLRDAVQTFVREQEDALKSMRGSKDDLSAQVKSIALLVWYMHRDMFESNDSSSSRMPSAISVIPSILDHLVAQLQVEDSPTTKTTEKGLTNYYCPLIVASLSLCQTLCSYGLIEEQEESGCTIGSISIILSICQVVAACTSERLLRPPPSYAREECEGARLLRYRVLFGAIALLGSMGKAIPGSCPTQALEAIREAFLRIFSTQEEHDRNMTGLALTALVRFGHAVSATHARCLPTFLPKSRVAMFQARGQGMIWKNSCHYEIDNSLYSFQQLGAALEVWTHQRPLEKSIFPALGSYYLAPGSFFLQMPTQNGRQALVIFPPGEQPLQDIRHMYELQDDDELPQVQSLKRVVQMYGSSSIFMRSDGGCKCILSDFSS